MDLTTIGHLPLVMGILNATPDSFSDGGSFNSLDKAIYHAETMLQDGADIIDIGGESTRPGADDVSEQQELDRVIPIIEKITQQLQVYISIDTSKALVMREAIAAGASLVNDVRALREPAALQTVAELQVPVCLMHMQGQPRTMQQAPQYQHIVADVKAFLTDRINACESVGIDKKHIIIDPGFGFGKTLQHNVALFKNLNQLLTLDCPLLVGVSRKAMIGQLIVEAENNIPSVEQRMQGSVTAALKAVEYGASILRVHDVKQTTDALKIWQQL